MDNDTLLKISIVGGDERNGIEVACEATNDIKALTTAVIGAMRIPSFAAAANTAVLLTAAKAGKLDELINLIRENRERLTREANQNIVSDYVDFRIGGGKKAPLS